MPERIPPEVRAARRDVARLVTERERLPARGGPDRRRRPRAASPRSTADRRACSTTCCALIDPCDAERDRAARAAAGAARDAVRRRAEAQATLRVRIYPDEIHVDDLARGLTDEETRPGRPTGRASGPNRPRDAPGQTFVAAVGADRAEWVAHAIDADEPRRAGHRGDAGIRDRSRRAGRATSSPGHCPTGSSSSPSRATRSRRAVGSAIPPDLALSPIPLDGDEPDAGRGRADGAARIGVARRLRPRRRGRHGGHGRTRRRGRRRSIGSSRSAPATASRPAAARRRARGPARRPPLRRRPRRCSPRARRPTTPTRSGRPTAARTTPGRHRRSPRPARDARVGRDGRGRRARASTPPC